MKGNLVAKLEPTQKPDQQLADDIITLLRLIFIASRRQELYHKPLPRTHNHQFHALYMLHYSGESNITMSGLAEALGTSKQQASKLVANLEEKSLAYREHDAVNRRQVYVRITTAGITYVEKTLDELRDWLGLETIRLGLEDQQTLQQGVAMFLEVISNRLNHHTLKYII